MLKNVQKKRRKWLIWVVSLFLLTFLAVYIFYPSVNIYLILNTFPFLSIASRNEPTFYGENIDMSQILPESQHYVVNKKGQDLIDIAANLGINLIRITNAQQSFNNNADSLYTKDQWNQVLKKMQSKGIKALILIETASSNAAYYTPEIRSVYLHLVQEYIDSGVFSNPDVYAVDIKNEPLLTDANLKMLQTAHTMIKAKYPDLKQTVGWWATPQSPNDPYNPNDYNWSDYAAGQQLASLVDFYSIHLYGLDTDNLGIHLSPDLKTKEFLSQVENGLQTKKPILIEEFGEANGDAVSDQDTIGNPQLQASVYQGVYQALQEMRSSQILGSVAFDFYSRTQYPDAWAIVKDHGNYLFPAAFILQEYALGKNNLSLRTATVVTSQSYLVTHADNNSTKTLHVSDRLGLTLQFANSNNYSLVLSTQNLLQPLEVFHYDTSLDAYDAVYQATSQGSVQLTIFPDASCSSSAICTAYVYSLTITIQ